MLAISRRLSALRDAKPRLLFGFIAMPGAYSAASGGQFFVRISRLFAKMLGNEYQRGIIKGLLQPSFNMQFLGELTNVVTAADEGYRQIYIQRTHFGNERLRVHFRDCVIHE